MYFIRQITTIINQLNKKYNNLITNFINGKITKKLITILQIYCLNFLIQK